MPALPTGTTNVHRFSLWLRALDEKALRESYTDAIRCITFSDSAYPIGDPVNLPIQDVGDGLMSLLMKLNELSCSGGKFINREFTIIFTDVSAREPFQNRFFSARSNWFNSKGRYLIATTASTIRVEAVDMSGKTAIIPVDIIRC